MSILHAYTVTATDATTAGIVHPADWVAAHDIAAGTELNGLAPVGSVSPYCGTVAGIPAGWLFCNGSSLLRAGSYAGLFAIIGTLYGSADGTHFNLPDLRDLFAVGATQDDAGLPKANITGGLTQSYAAGSNSLTHSITIAAHTIAHTGLSVAAHSAAALTHGVAIADHPSLSLTISVADQGTVGRTGTRTASGVVSAGAHAWTDPTVPTRGHTITQPDHAAITHTVTQPTGHTGDLTHSFTVPSAHTIAATSKAPAFLALSYMIRYL